MCQMLILGFCRRSLEISSDKCQVQKRKFRKVSQFGDDLQPRNKKIKSITLSKKIAQMILTRRAGALSL